MSRDARVLCPQMIFLTITWTYNWKQRISGRTYSWQDTCMKNSCDLSVHVWSTNVYYTRLRSISRAKCAIWDFARHEIHSRVVCNDKRMIGDTQYSSFLEEYITSPLIRLSQYLSGTTEETNFYCLNGRHSIIWPIRSQITLRLSLNEIVAS